MQAEQAYCLDCEFRAYAFTLWRCTSLGAGHATQTNHRVRYKVVEMEWEEFYRLTEND